MNIQCVSCFFKHKSLINRDAVVETDFAVSGLENVILTLLPQIWTRLSGF